MNKDQNRLDKLFSDKLRKKEYKAGDADWDAMEELLDKRESTGFLNWLNKNKFYSAVIMLALIGATAFYSLNRFNKHELSTTENKESTKTNNIQTSTPKIESNKVQIMSGSQNVPATKNNTVALTNNNEKNTNDLNEALPVIKDVSDEIELTTLANNKGKSSQVSKEMTDVHNNADDDYNTYAKVEDLSKAAIGNKIDETVKNRNESESNLEGKALNDADNENVSELNSKQSTVDDAEKFEDEMNSSVSPRMELDKENETIPDSNTLLDNSGIVQNHSNIEKTQSLNEKAVVADTSGGTLNANASETSINNASTQNMEQASSSNSNRVIDTENAIVTNERKELENQIEKPILYKDSLNVKNLVNDTLQKQSNYKVYLGLSASTAFVSKKMDATQPLSAEYLARRKNEESNTVNFHGGLNATVQFSQFMFSTGFNYATYSEKLNYNPISKFTVLDSVYVLVPDSTPTGGNNFDTIWSVQINLVDSLNMTIASRNGKTTWSYFEIPAMFWYRMDKGKISIDGGVGGSIGMLRKVNSYYLNPELSDLENINSEGNYKDVVYNAIVASRIHYKMNEHWLVGLDLRYKQNVTSIFKSEYPVEQRFRSFNAGLSIMYRIK